MGGSLSAMLLVHVVSADSQIVVLYCMRQDAYLLCSYRLYTGCSGVDVREGTRLAAHAGFSLILDLVFSGQATDHQQRFLLSQLAAGQIDGCLLKQRRETRRYCTEYKYIGVVLRILQPQ